MSWDPFSLWGLVDCNSKTRDSPYSLFDSVMSVFKIKNVRIQTFYFNKYWF